MKLRTYIYPSSVIKKIHCFRNCSPIIVLCCSFPFSVLASVPYSLSTVQQSLILSLFFHSNFYSPFPFIVLTTVLATVLQSLFLPLFFTLSSCHHCSPFIVLPLFSNRCFAIIFHSQFLPSFHFHYSYHRSSFTVHATVHHSKIVPALFIQSHVTVPIHCSYHRHRSPFTVLVTVHHSQFLPSFFIPSSFQQRYPLTAYYYVSIINCFDIVLTFPVNSFQHSLSLFVPQVFSQCPCHRSPFQVLVTVVNSQILLSFPIYCSHHISLFIVLTNVHHFQFLPPFTILSSCHNSPFFATVYHSRSLSPFTVLTTDHHLQFLPPFTNHSFYHRSPFTIVRHHSLFIALVTVHYSLYLLFLPAFTIR